jgi:asparagine synthase (glutamine-hydrolysing)
MCGINGFNWNDKHLLGEMNRTIKSRGPDADGTYIDGKISLGHVRLSIIDLSSKANQPMRYNNDLFLVYNGEIYNFIELKKDLENKGVIFTTRSDTEVLLNGYHYYGFDFFSKLNGIFAFCFYDTQKNQLILGRDRLGIKPLYYAFDGDNFIFSSEIKALMKNTKICPHIDKDLIYSYLLTVNIPGESLFSNILCVPPGAILSFDITNKKISIDKYFEKTEKIDKDKYLSGARETELVDTLDRLLNDVIKNQLVADVEVGTICSGGLDSSLVTAIASRYSKKIKVFHVSIPDDELDESRYAKKVAEFLDLDIIIEELDQEKFRNNYERCIRFEDLPLSHPNSVGIFLLSKKACDHGVPVLLSGEGADELFGGYWQYNSYYAKLLREQKTEKILKYPLLQILTRALTYYWLTDRYPDKKFYEMDGTLAEEWRTIVANYNLVPWEQYKINIQNKCFEKFNFIKDPVERKVVSYMMKDLDYYLVPILRRSDRMSMACGVEMRVPYLDNTLLEFAINLPLKYKITKNIQKYLLKKVAERYLPKDIVYREKNGFGLPLGRWKPEIGFDDFSFRSAMLSKTLAYYEQEFNMKTDEFCKIFSDSHSY